MAKRDIDILIKARDAASETFKKVERNAGASMRRMNRNNKGGKGKGAGFGKAAGAAATRVAFAGVAAGATAAAFAATEGAKASMEYEHALARVNTMLSGDSTAIMAKYKTQLSQMSAVYGQSTDVLATGLFDVISAGVPAADAVAMLDAATRSAIGGNTDAATSVDAITTVLNAYGKSASEASGVSDVMFQTVKSGKITFGQLAGNIATVAPMAKAAGVSFEKLGALVATAVKVEKPERAMTQISAVMRAAAKDGTDLFQFLEGFEGKNLTEILGSGVDSETAKGIALLTRDMTALNAEVGKMENASGATEEAFGKMTNTNKFHVEQFKQSWGVLMRKIGDGVFGVGDFGAAIDKVGGVIRNLPEYGKVAVLDFRTSFIGLLSFFRQTGLRIGQIFDNVIDAVSDRFGAMIVAVQSGLQAIKSGDLNALGDSAKQLASNAAGTNIVSLAIDAGNKTFGEQGQKEFGKIMAGDALLKGLDGQLAEMVGERDGILAGIEDNNAAFADQLKAGIAGGVGGALAKGAAGAGNEGGGGGGSTRVNDPGRIMSRFLTGASFGPMDKVAEKLAKPAKEAAAASKKIAAGVGELVDLAQRQLDQPQMQLVGGSL